MNAPTTAWARDAPVNMLCDSIKQLQSFLSAGRCVYSFAQYVISNRMGLKRSLMTARDRRLADLNEVRVHFQIKSQRDVECFHVVGKRDDETGDAHWRTTAMAHNHELAARRWSPIAQVHQGKAIHCETEPCKRKEQSNALRD